MSYAIIEASGRQFWVEPNKFVEFNHLYVRLGSIISLKRILFVNKENEIFIGKPYLENIEIQGTISKHFLGPKIIVFKMKPKKKYRRKMGHRQKLTRLLINQIK